MTNCDFYGQLKQVIFYLVSISLIFCPTLSYAQTVPQNNIVVDQSSHAGGQSPNFQQSQNGTDVLNIVSPTHSGVSHNKFTEYNVNEQGLIVNNLTFKHGVGQAESAIGGTVTYNANLGLGNAARVILNEVTSNSTTSLKGYTEIFGEKAALVIANPNGITCEGCGFINTSRLSMVTGTPNMDNGDLKDFNMSSGIIEIKGVGDYHIGLHVDGSPAQIVANTVKVAGLVLVDDDQQLEVLTGNDRFDYKTSQISSDNISAVGVAIDSSAIGGMYAGRIKIHATQKGFGVNTDGNLVASTDNIEITADGDIVYKNAAANKSVEIESKQGNIKAKSTGTTFANNEIILVSNTGDVELEGEYLYAANIGIGAGNNIVNKGQIFADNHLYLESEQKLDNQGEIVSIQTAEIVAGHNLNNQAQGIIISGAGTGLYAGNNINNEGEVSSGYLTELIAANNINNEGVLGASAILSLYSDNKITNTGEISSGSVLLIESADSIENQSKVNAADYVALKADAIRNYGQIASAGDIEIEAAQDFINYRDSAVLSGKDIIMTVGRNLINYMAEIFSVNSIIFTGTTGITDSIDTSLDYDNPYITDTRIYDPAGTGQPTPNTGETTEPVVIYLTDIPVTLTLPPDAFGSDPQPGDTYTFSEGYTLTLDTNIDDFIITDSSNTVFSYTLFGDDNQQGTTPPPPSTTPEENSNLGPFANSSPFASQPDAMNSLQNIGGRIESFGDISINTDKLHNIGKDYNTGADGYSTAYNMILPMAYWDWGTMEIGRYYITDTYFSSVSGQILAGNDLNILSREILNQSSTLSGKNNVSIKTDDLKNLTSSYLANIAIIYQARKKSSGKVWNGVGYYQDRIYSTSHSLITAGNTLSIDATGGNIINDQVESAISSFYFGRSNEPSYGNGVIGISLNLPNGSNGLFVVGHDPKYLVTSNVSFFNAGDFIGSDYFFDRITPISGPNNTRKIIGDAAYETRLIMDALRQATSGHYLGTGEIGSDTEQMKALYANAETEYKRLNLQVGIALTEEQISSLTSDIIWYVEKEIEGQLVLVPELYLSQATRSQIAQGSSNGAKMTGGNVAITGDYISNSGDIFAKNQLYLKADYLNNESNWLNRAQIIGGNSTTITADLLKNSGGLISGTTTQITTKNLINETKVFAEDTKLGSNKWHVEKAGHDGTISGTDGLKIDVEETFHSIGGNLESSEGSIYLTADDVIFDSAKVINSSEMHMKAKGTLTKKEGTLIKENLRNVVSTVAAAGDINITSGNNIDSTGTQFIAGQDLNLTATNDVLLKNATDYDYFYSEHKKEKKEVVKEAAVVVVAAIAAVVTFGVGAAVVAAVSAKQNSGGMKSGGSDVIETYDEKTVSGLLSAENINIKSGNDTVIISNDLVGTNVNIDAGNQIVFATADERHERKESHDRYSVDLGGALVGAAVGGVITGMMGNMGGVLAGTVGEYGGLAGGYSVTGGIVGFGSKNQQTTYTETSSTLQSSSNLIAADNIVLKSKDDMIVIGSNISAGQDIDMTSEQGDIKILSAEEQHKTYEKTKERGESDISWFNGTNGDKVISGINIATIEKGVKETETISTSTTQKSSNIIAGGEINVTADDGKVEVKGSNIIADGDINIHGETGVDITSAENIFSTDKKEKEKVFSMDASVNNTFLELADHAVKTGDSFVNGQDDTASHVNQFANVGNGTVAYLAAGDLSDLATSGQYFGFKGNMTISENITETTEHHESVTNTGSYIGSGEGNINISTGKGDLNVKGSDIEAKGDINLATLDGGDINIISSQDTSSGSTNTSTDSLNISIGMNASGPSMPLPTYGSSDSDSSYSSVSQNHSTITSHEGGININANKNNTVDSSDINIEGANIKAQDDINMTAESGNINIASTQDSFTSNEHHDSYQLGGTIGLGVGKHEKEKVTNNLTTIESDSGSVNINTNDLTLTEVNKDNMNLSGVTGDITENRLYEKDKEDWYDFNISYNLPINLLPQDSTMDGKNKSQTPIKDGDWIGSLKNTTVTYRDDNGYNFSASLASIEAGAGVIAQTVEVGGYVAEKVIGEFLSQLSPTEQKDIVTEMETQKKLNM